MNDIIWEFSDEILKLDEAIRQENDYWDVSVRIGIKRLRRKLTIQAIQQRFITDELQKIKKRYE